MIIGRMKIMASDIGQTNMLSEANDLTQMVTSAGSSALWFGKNTYTQDDIDNGPLCSYATGRRATWWNSNKATRILYP